MKGPRRYLPQSKFGSPSAVSIQSPREWVATAHPLGKHVPQTADKPKDSTPNSDQSYSLKPGWRGCRKLPRTALITSISVTMNRGRIHRPGGGRSTGFGGAAG